MHSTNFKKSVKVFKHGPEELEMIAFFDYCRIKEAQDARYGLIFHIPNERKASIQRRITLARAGVKKGTPDICVPWGNDKYQSLFIEMKVKPNRASPEQMAKLKHLNAVGNYACICWSASDAIEILRKYEADAL